MEEIFETRIQSNDFRIHLLAKYLKKWINSDKCDGTDMMYLYHMREWIQDKQNLDDLIKSDHAFCDLLSRYYIEYFKIDPEDRNFMNDIKQKFQKTNS